MNTILFARHPLFSGLAAALVTALGACSQSPSFPASSSGAGRGAGQGAGGSLGVGMSQGAGGSLGVGVSQGAGASPGAGGACGNGMASIGEQCDGTALGGATSEPGIQRRDR